MRKFVVVGQAQKDSLFLGVTFYASTIKAQASGEKYLY
jgi:hypothetical protein